MASAMRSDSKMKVNLVGYADKQGLESYNLKLSERRAKAVMDALVNSYGIDAARISTMGKGANEMAASDMNDMNRRVEFVRSN
jgi:OOP family OmpA-OmpF porin